MMSERETRLHQIRNQLIAEGSVRALLLALFWCFLCFVPDTASAALRLRSASLLFLFVLVPGLIYQWRRYRVARRTAADMWAFGTHDMKEISRAFAAYMTVRTDIKDATPYIVVMHD